MEPEVLWNDHKTRNFLEDLKSFARSLDYYEILIEVDKPDDRKFVYLHDGDYDFSSGLKQGAFACPKCGRLSFDVLEGEIDNKPALGLCCISCETYGAVFPAGL